MPLTALNSNIVLFFYHPKFNSIQPSIDVHIGTRAGLCMFYLFLLLLSPAACEWVIWLCSHNDRLWCTVTRTSASFTTSHVVFWFHFLLLAESRPCARNWPHQATSGRLTADSRARVKGKFRYVTTLCVFVCEYALHLMHACGRAFAHKNPCEYLLILHYISRS